MSKTSELIRKTARRIFEYDSLRPGQEEAITSVLEGNDTLVVMPTGSGKSAIYQIPAVLLDGPSIVVSPLIALQRDQSEALNKQHEGIAAVVNSMISPTAQEAAVEGAEQGATEFLFLAPEQFSNPERMEAVKAAKPSLFVVDEAHCISEWGHSFRPAYLGLGKVIEELGHPIVLALTATANEDVRAEIVARLGMRDPRVLVHGFDRPNIWLGVETATSEVKKRAMLLDRIRNSQRPGIVYASTRKHAKEISGELNSVGIASALYHGGLNKADREAMQEQFMSEQVEVIVATSAFGMGVDKPNVRFVFHYEPPDSVDSYYQEVGRAGRDGEPAVAVLFYNSKDLGLHKFFKSTGRISRRDVQLVLQTLKEDVPIAVSALREQVGLSKIKLSRVLARLEDDGAITMAPEGVVGTSANADKLLKTAEAASAAQAERHRAELERIEKVQRYAENLSCRRAFLLGYFGEDSPPQCGSCDICQGRGTQRAELLAEVNLAMSE